MIHIFAQYVKIALSIHLQQKNVQTSYGSSHNTPNACCTCLVLIAIPYSTSSCVMYAHMRD